jgi:hypothetical protein
MADGLGHQQRVGLDRYTGDNMSVSILSISFERHHQAFDIGKASPVSLGDSKAPLSIGNRRATRYCYFDASLVDGG